MILKYESSGTNEELKKLNLAIMLFITIYIKQTLVVYICHTYGQYAIIMSIYATWTNWFWDPKLDHQTGRIKGNLSIFSGQ